MRSGGLERTYYVHLPPQYDGKTKLPLVMLLHGGGGNATQALRNYPLQPLADREGFILVAPDGTGPGPLHTWNVEFGFGSAQRRQVDDTGYIRDLTGQLQKELAVDPKRVYLTGLSNGAILCHWAAARSPELFAGIAPVVGTVGGRDEHEKTLHMPPVPAKGVPIVFFMGEQDQSVPLLGGLQGKHADSRKWMVSAEDTAKFWVAANGCDPKPVVEELADKGSTRKSWLRAGRPLVVMYIVHDQGHAWPGGSAPRLAADKPSQKIAAHEVMWEFWKGLQH